MDSAGSEVCSSGAQHGEQRLLSQVHTSGFWIDGFIETACLRVIAIAVLLSSLSSGFKTPLERRKKEIQTYDVVFSLK